MVISKKYFDITAHPEAKWPSQQNIQFFFLFHYFFSSTCGHNFDRTVPWKSSVPSRICLVKKRWCVPKSKFKWSNSLLTSIILAFRQPS